MPYEELEKLEEDLEEEIAKIKKLVDPFQRQSMRDYSFYKKHRIILITLESWQMKKMIFLT